MDETLSCQSQASSSQYGYITHANTRAVMFSWEGGDDHVQRLLHKVRAVGGSLLPTLPSAMRHFRRRERLTTRASDDMVPFQSEKVDHGI